MRGHGGPPGRRLIQGAVAALLPIGLLAGCGTDSGVVAGGTPECPTAPVLAGAAAGDLQRPALAAPARTDVRAGRFVRMLTLDHDALVVAPPRSHDRPKFSGDKALCQVLASALSNGAPIGRQTPDSFAVGLGRVTVSDALLHHSRLAGVTEYGSIDGIPNVNPRPPAPQSYHDRLAWVVVVEDIEASSCGAARPNETSPPRHVDTSLHGYAVFLVDATAGSDALLYTERMNPNCPGGYPSGPWVDVPLTTTSIPWQLVSELPDRTSGTVRFQVAACDGYAGVTTAGNSAPPDVVRVSVTRPFGRPCRPLRTVTEKLRARNVGDLLPHHLRHAPLGPYIAG